MNNVLQNSVTQLVADSPVLIAYLVGAILSLVSWKRCPNAFTCSFIASAALLLNSVVLAFVRNALIQNQMAQGWTAVDLGHKLTAIGLVGSIVRAGAFGLLIAAVYIGRSDSPLTNSRIEHTRIPKGRGDRDETEPIEFL
jgi:hypothetical protein